MAGEADRAGGCPSILTVRLDVAASRIIRVLAFRLSAVPNFTSTIVPNSF
jgi:hypothetical protein